ncbi:hypothetical protein SAMN05444959_101334 [Paracoccus seriniphilus]|uniref:Uncharacterized protein n=1 Tax=Paracoccus seriniphilus TaxID=184748 RepID=A0A239PNQ5_9RHOB|nr:hypothetical protein SAMN05444959_101334 [Paracoccus seriniphilus]
MAEQYSGSFEAGHAGLAAVNGTGGAGCLKVGQSQAVARHNPPS